MESKKPVYPDENSWLVQYIIRYFKSLKAQPDYSLWDELVVFNKSMDGSCDYIYDTEQSDNTLYPVLSYDEKNHKVILNDFEWICSVVYDLKTGNFLSFDEKAVSTPVQPIETRTEAHKPQPVKSVVPDLQTEEKLGFFARLIRWWNRRKEVAKTSNAESPVATSANVASSPKYTSSSSSTRKMSEFEDNNIPNLDIDRYAQNLVEINGIDLHQAKEILLSSSYNRRINSRLFANHLENDLELGLPVLKVKFDISFLYNSGVLNSEIGKEFKKLLDNKKQIELEFEIDTPEIIIDPLLEETQLIKIAK
ncbi:hypothetical protein J2Z62_000108 [Mycoplasmoides fastidiosum]|uniref:Uncharacterized protein n=1 Tax=Mycoplasmoides fastidiosum TaxID=92758 RepID=A0ABU0LYA1_9BACT|nr:hypothetical protein [Mycoplasmoides fastidiosum]MDQ0513670.1 hypothetical protein [Mycoplasmoides fastidiosum]UUD37911.1 hypothetical protein NPA10_00745 [Mycoplasmoides fastidiosum]